MKKSIAVLALALALTGSLAACSNRDPNANNTTGSGTTSGSGAVSGTTSGSAGQVARRYDNQSVYNGRIYDGRTYGGRRLQRPGLRQRRQHPLPGPDPGCPGHRPGHRGRAGRRGPWHRQRRPGHHWHGQRRLLRHPQLGARLQRGPLLTDTGTGNRPSRVFSLTKAWYLL